MALELKVPEMGESITEVQIGEWLKGEGEKVRADEAVVVIESEKATVDLPAPASGTVTKVLKRAGESARVGEIIGYLEESTAPPSPAPAVASHEKQGAVKVESRPAASAASTPVSAPVATPDSAPVAAPASNPGGEPGREEEIIPLSPVRRRIASRLVEAQHTAALLTTFNEIDMSAIVDLRKEQQASFQARHGVKLGMMSFFVKATIEALKLVPQLNAELRGNDVAYRNYHDIGIAVGGGKGLVVPVLRDADRKSFAEIEKSIADFAQRATEGKLMPSELRGGTFTISNGGVYGSLLSTPIVNPPQSGVLGMHAIQERPVAREGQVVIRPMMYIALTYDHRIVDGREAVTFLKRVRECVEAPWRILIDI